MNFLISKLILELKNLIYGNKMNKNKLKWNNAKKFIPTGNMFLSKNPKRFIEKYGQHILIKAKDVKFGI